MTLYNVEMTGEPYWKVWILDLVGRIIGTRFKIGGFSYGGPYTKRHLHEDSVERDHREGCPSSLTEECCK